MYSVVYKLQVCLVCYKSSREFQRNDIISPHGWYMEFRRCDFLLFEGFDAWLRTLVILAETSMLTWFGLFRNLQLNAGPIGRGCLSQQTDKRHSAGGRECRKDNMFVSRLPLVIIHIIKKIQLFSFRRALESVKIDKLHGPLFLLEAILVFILHVRSNNHNLKRLTCPLQPFPKQPRTCHHPLLPETPFSFFEICHGFPRKVHLRSNNNEAIA